MDVNKRKVKFLKSVFLKTKLENICDPHIDLEYNIKRYLIIRANKIKNNRFYDKFKETLY